ncbi:peptide ABC transporter substrate-binding protein [Patescibacteria group bacterium]|nr:peptide ABC transporter substrate-binding protein [Patescibacteria group bacterium]
MKISDNRQYKKLTESLSHFKQIKKVSLKQWARLPKVLPLKERWITRIFIFLIFASVVALLFNLYLDKTYIEPQMGGTYTEGILGQTRFINPVLAQTNDADRDLTQIIYSSLFKYDGQGNLILDLVKSYNISEDGLSYEIKIRENIKWHNDEQLTIDDVIYTIKTIQDPEFKSPLKNNWQGVEMEKIDNLTMNFKLSNVYSPFLHNLTIGIMPKHLWAGISAQNFALAQYNVQPIGSGPYKFNKINKNDNGEIELIGLIRNENFYLHFEGSPKGPFIENIIFKFFNNQIELIDAYKRRQIDGLSFVSGINQLNIVNDLNIYEINIPAYYAVFFNQTKSKALADKTVRLALSYATNKEEIISKILSDKGIQVDSPLLPGWFGYTPETSIYEFAIEHAQNILESAEWKDSDDDGIREKTINNEEVKLEINILTTDWPELKQTAELLKEQWEKIGAKVNLEILDAVTVQQDYIKTREYEALLFGEVLNADPDPFAFWHSSQRKDPGLNLAVYGNDDIDKLLEDARQSIDQESRKEKYMEFQKLLIKDAPAVFLYSPTYIYPVNKKVKGISIEKFSQPSHRFSLIENWFIKTNRIWK